MTDQQKKLVAEIREANKTFDIVSSLIAGDGKVATGGLVEGAMERINKALDALEADGKCKRVTYDSECYIGKNKVYRSQEFCSECSTALREECSFCPGCGREIDPT